jgi:hypothetical protein
MSRNDVPTLKFRQSESLWQSYMCSVELLAKNALSEIVAMLLFDKSTYLKYMKPI